MTTLHHCTAHWDNPENVSNLQVTWMMFYCQDFSNKSKTRKNLNSEQQLWGPTEHVQMNTAFPPQTMNLLLPDAAVFLFYLLLEDINETKEWQGATPALQPEETECLLSPTLAGNAAFFQSYFGRLFQSVIIIDESFRFSNSIWIHSLAPPVSPPPLCEYQSYIIMDQLRFIEEISSGDL